MVVNRQAHGSCNKSSKMRDEGLSVRHSKGHWYLPKILPMTMTLGAIGGASA
jgi:hypothetical protein